MQGTDVRVKTEEILKRTVAKVLSNIKITDRHHSYRRTVKVRFDIQILNVAPKTLPPQDRLVKTSEVDKANETPQTTIVQMPFRTL